MNWTTFVKSVRRPTHRSLSSPPRHRPTLDTLEDRTVLSPVSFHIVQNQSPLTLSGTIGGAVIQAQWTVSLTTTYFCDFQGDVVETNGAINFIGTANDFCASNTGSCAPLPDGSGG